MLRQKKNLVVIALMSVAVLAAMVGLFWRYSDHRPTSEEFRVYGGFLNRLAADGHLQRNNFALARMTLALSDPQYESWIPTELRSDKTHSSSEFAAYCGFCARTFVGQNMAPSRLEPDPHGEFGVFIVEPPEPTQKPSKDIVSVTRVGFNLLHTRAVLSYSTSCSDDSNSMCLELGEAYLRKEKGVWKVDHYQAFTF
jgi:hypothetical protein